MALRAQRLVVKRFTPIFPHRGFLVRLVEYGYTALAEGGCRVPHSLSNSALWNPSQDSIILLFLFFVLNIMFVCFCLFVLVVFVGSYIKVYVSF